ncbi:MAG: saccharopine dehydrogenase family protein [Candidatus Korarchaeota archaeon]|nr:saccharopine dehydrogenase family protein [Candidatus Korarchaeota archaeon]NIU84973.1 saccharopine dehydrogenase family protein [Candidatus Thorarchaeota archaeon]NIW14996.1 saccharopine dehydrogenase family protein [Candidatus Thorarchaeota archaeon]NIW53006.1 saccharopine dehydrogenase family protein [Candidatus Korarchaeota archaeon]
MKILVLGAGNIGQVIAYKLHNDFEVTVGDVQKEKVTAIQPFAYPIQVDARKQKALINTMSDFDVIVDALPGNLGHHSLEAAIKAKKDIVSVSFMPEDPLKLQEEAKHAEVSIIPDAGLAPGISNVCIGRIHQELDELEEGVIRVGGLPQDARPPLFYKSTWSPYDLIEEYTRNARIIRENEIVTVDPFRTIENVTIADYELEEIITDGLRTLLKTITAQKLQERTVRWKGHLEKMKVLKELGFFKAPHLDATLEVLLPHMQYESEDFTIMEVIGTGTIKGTRKEIKYFLYDEKQDFTSMARTTGFTAEVITRLVANKTFEPSVIPPETFNINTCDKVLSGLRRRGITIERTEKTVN